MIDLQGTDKISLLAVSAVSTFEIKILPAD